MSNTQNSDESVKVVVVMPAYNAASTLEATLEAIPPGSIDEIILVDDASEDRTVQLANELQLRVIVHPHNVGYGGNQKTCYMEALREDADIVIMLHPDGQYDPELIPDLIAAIVEDEAHIVLGSRFLRPGGARAGGMPLWKFVANRFLTFIENMAFRQGLSEYHTGYRAYSSHFLRTVPFLRNDNGFVFDTQILAQASAFGFKIDEIPVETRYFAQASSVGLKTSILYGLGTLKVVAGYLFHQYRIWPSRLFRR